MDSDTFFLEAIAAIASNTASTTNDGSYRSSPPASEKLVAEDDGAQQFFSIQETAQVNYSTEGSLWKYLLDDSRWKQREEPKGRGDEGEVVRSSTGTRSLFPPVVPAPLPSPLATGEWQSTLLFSSGDNYLLFSPCSGNRDDDSAGFFFPPASSALHNFFTPEWNNGENKAAADINSNGNNGGGSWSRGEKRSAELSNPFSSLPPDNSSLMMLPSSDGTAGTVTPQTYAPLFGNGNGKAELTTISPACGSLKRAVRLGKVSAQPSASKRTRRLSSKTEVLSTSSDDSGKKARKFDKSETGSKTDCSSSVSGTFTGLAAGTNGENRLRIKFESFGKKPSNLQRYGKNGCFIPDGLRGTHEMYDQLWRFEVVYHQDHPKGAVRLIWRITNLASNLRVELMETPQQAARREESGRTICNKVVKMAMNARAQELEHLFMTKSALMNQAERASLENSIRVLRPKLFTVGLLFFGLLHDAVQIHLQ